MKIKLLLGLIALLLGNTAALAQTEPLGGQPAPGAKASVNDLREQVLYQRTFEAVLWSMPAVSIYRMRAGSFSALGVSDNDIMAFSTPCTPLCEVLTGHNVTPYIVAFTDLRKGPVVLEIPAKTDKAVLYGQIVDAWQTSVVDVGPLGADKGAGTKLLLLPPGYNEEIPGDYLPVKTGSYRMAFTFRSIPLAGATPAEAYAYSKTLKMYYLADAANLKPQKFVDPTNQRFPTLPIYSFQYLHDLYEVISVEPVHTRDKVMMGMLASIGMEPGKPFNPTDQDKAVMEKAVVDAYFYMQEQTYALLDANPYWPNRGWSNALQPDPSHGFEYVTANSILLDNRAVQFFLGTFYPKTLAEGQAANLYLLAGEDKSGNRLAAGKTYRLRVPKDIPASQFWSLTVYDRATWAFIYSSQERVGLSSFDKDKMKLNDDGSVDLYVGPKAPEGFESNWIPTQGKVPAPMFRYYGAQPSLWDKSFVMSDFELVE